MTIYLDNAATSFPKAPLVAEAVSRQILKEGGNAGRASHSMARQASGLLFDVRDETAELLGIKNSERLIFTKNATEALNIAIMGTVPENGTVITSSLEHNSVMRPLRHLEAEKNVKIIVISFDGAGNPDAWQLADALKNKPDLAVFMAASNVTGAILPFEDLVSKCNKAGIPVCIDGSQIAGHYPLDLDSLGADFFCFAGHKGLLAPMGTGGVYIKEGVTPEPLMRGGTGSASFSEEQPIVFPDAYEAGTPNLTGLAGMLASVRFIKETGLSNIIAKEEKLSEKLLEGIFSIGNMKIYGYEKGKRRTPAVSVNIDGMTPDALALELDRQDICTRMGLHCAPAAHKSIGTFNMGGTVRFSLGYFTAEEEIEQTIEVLRKIAG